ncbi:hypothetical protein CC86DRAFT_15875 [Ophiobolus disseminans]|uniref:Uncharacterized protein n=1 Tax=Ophiobolus disseminans TaxID=1469910 RepID=A0A6A7AL27_9PLEO|nr:hypothetical protein CC86DRAFT_15875 [Ophiobolus disseminans]
MATFEDEYSVDEYSLSGMCPRRSWYKHNVDASGHATTLVVINLRDICANHTPTVLTCTFETRPKSTSIHNLDYEIWPGQQQDSRLHGCTVEFSHDARICIVKFTLEALLQVREEENIHKRVLCEQAGELSQPLPLRLCPTLQDALERWTLPTPSTLETTSAAVLRSVSKQYDLLK